MTPPGRPIPSVCPFLRRQVGGRRWSRPFHGPGEEQACVAIGAPRLQSLRQQELVCLRAAHADCPRYLRGAMESAPGHRAEGPDRPAGHARRAPGPRAQRGDLVRVRGPAWWDRDARRGCLAIVIGRGRRREPPTAPPRPLRRPRQPRPSPGSPSASPSGTTRAHRHAEPHRHANADARAHRDAHARSPRRRPRATATSC